MGSCELCGRETQLVNAIVEGTFLTVCNNCSHYGSAVAVEPSRAPSQRPAPSSAEPREFIDPHYPHLIKTAREQRGLKQAELAHLLGEKESVLQHIESAQLPLSFDLARKIEKALSITLVVSYEEPSLKGNQLKDNYLTIGDILKLKQKK